MALENPRKGLRRKCARPPRRCARSRAALDPAAGRALDERALELDAAERRAFRSSSAKKRSSPSTQRIGTSDSALIAAGCRRRSPRRRRRGRRARPRSRPTVGRTADDRAGRRAAGARAGARARRADAVAHGRVAEADEQLPRPIAAFSRARPASVVGSPRRIARSTRSASLTARSSRSASSRSCGVVDVERVARVHHVRPDVAAVEVVAEPVGAQREHRRAVPRVEERLLLPRPRASRARRRGRRRPPSARRAVACGTSTTLTTASAPLSSSRRTAASTCSARRSGDVGWSSTRTSGDELGERVPDDVEHRRLVRRELGRAAQHLDARRRRDLVVVGRDDDARELARPRAPRRPSTRAAACRRAARGSCAGFPSTRRAPGSGPGRPSVRHPLVDRERALREDLRDPLARVPSP